MPALVTSENLVKRYGRVSALESVDFDIQEGITGLLGANGAGKSTSIRLALGLIKPTSGTIRVLGEVPHESIEIRQKLGYMPEHDCLPDNTSASEFLSHMAEVSGLPPANARTRAADILRHVGLHEERYRPIGEYSTGMKQRVKLAQALVHDPVLVLLDEPTAGLDPTGREEMLDLILRTGQEFAISMILSSHLLGDVQKTCDQIVVLDGGKIIQAGRIDDFTSATETMVVEVEDLRTELLDALGARGLRCSLEGLLILVTQETEDDLDQIRDALAETGAPLRRLGLRRNALSDIFRESAE